MEIEMCNECHLYKELNEHGRCHGCEEVEDILDKKDYNNAIKENVHNKKYDSAKTLKLKAIESELYRVSKSEGRHEDMITILSKETGDNFYISKIKLGELIDLLTSAKDIL